MGKAKGKRAPRKSAKPATVEPVATPPGRKFATLRPVTLPRLVCKIEAPVYCTVLGDLRSTDGVDALVQVKELESGATMDLHVPESLRKVFADALGGEIQGKSFCIIRHAKHDRKNQYGFTVEEIDPNKPADVADAS